MYINKRKERKEMAKNWKEVGNNALGTGAKETEQEKYRRMRRFDNAIRNLVKLKEDELIAKTAESYEEREAQKAQLLQAYADKRLKSKDLIKKAKGLTRKEKQAMIAEA